MGNFACLTVLFVFIRLGCADRGATKYREKNGTVPMDDFPGDFMSQGMRAHGGVIVHFILALYVFVGLAILCEKYFVPSVEKIGHKLNMSSDVCGATLMAMGTSGTELFTSVIGVFITKSDIGLAAIAGSMAFDILLTFAICGLFASSTLRLSRWPFLRDSFANLISVTALAVVTFDGKVYWFEAMVFISLYLLYLVVMFYNKTLEEIFQRFAPRRQNLIDVERELIESENKRLIQTDQSRDESLIKSGASEIQVIHPHHRLVSFLRNVVSWIPQVIALPFDCLYCVTIPDCRKDRWEGWFWVSFFVSLVWMGLLSYVLVWMVSIIGFTLGIPSAVMGITFLAAGSDVPDLLSNLILVRQGEGDMAVSHANGNNVFNMLFCLGFPWLLQTTLVDFGGFVPVVGPGMSFRIVHLYAIVLIPLIVFKLNKWFLNKCLGILFVTLYLTSTTVLVLFELKVLKL